MARKLTAKQEAYKNNRIAGMGVSESYKAAYNASGMSDKAVSKEADILEKDPRIAPAIKEKRKEATSSAVMTRQEALERLSIMARTSVKDIARFRKVKVGEVDGQSVFQSVWDMKDCDEITEEQAMSISELSASKDGLKFKMHSQASAIKQLTEMEGWNSATKHEHAGPGGGSIKSDVVVVVAEMTNEQAATIYKDLIG